MKVKLVLTITGIVFGVVFGPAFVSFIAPSLFTVWIPRLVRLALDNVLVTGSIVAGLFGLVGLSSLRGRKSQEKEVDLEPTKEEIQEEVLKAFAAHTEDLKAQIANPELFKVVEPEPVEVVPENPKEKLERLKRQILEGKSENE